MKSSQGQKYSINLFFQGLSADIDPELLASKEGSVLESHCLGVSNVEKNKLTLMRGDKGFVSTESPSSAIQYRGAIWLNGYVASFYFDTYTELVYIYANGLLIGQSADYPTGWLDIDSCNETSELFITDNIVSPIVLDLNDMIDSISTETYFTEYDSKLYSVNKPIQLNQPVFIQLEDLGPGGGLKYGSYAYAMCYSSISGESTPWSPLTPYIPVPEAAVTITSDAEDLFSGLKTYGAGPSLTPGRYGIRLRLRIANMSDFNYIKIKRYSNKTGQPVNYTPTAEFMILGADVNGSVLDIKNNKYNTIEFVDSNTITWAILDESVLNEYSTIKKARTIRYYDRRIVLGGVEYESKLIDDKDIFLLEEDMTRIAYPVLKQLEPNGFSSIYNQVYYKSHRCGERYGFGVKLNDEQGNTLFTIPLKHGTEAKNDFTNFKFPERRDPIPQGVARMDTITLSGTIGSATILCNTLSNNITFHLSLTQTAAEFVTANAAAYLAAFVVLTSLNEVLIFTSLTAGLDFTGSTSITTIAGSSDLSGTIVTTQAATPPTRQVDRIVFMASEGFSTITCEGISRQAVCYPDLDLDRTVSEFITNYEWVYNNAGILVAALSGAETGLQFTGYANGDPITTGASGVFIDSVYTYTPANNGQSQIDVVTLTGATGNAIITCNGLSKGITFDTSLAITAAKFVTDYAADYLLIGITVTSGVDDILFTGPDGNTTFVTTIVNAANDLTGGALTVRANAGAGFGELDKCTGQIEDSTVESWDSADVQYVYDPVAAKRVNKDDIATELNIVNIDSGGIKPYSPVTPTGRGDSANNNNYNGITQMSIMDTVETVDNNVSQYGRYISTLGLRIGGIDVTKLPSNIKSFSVVRTPAAGRVVCQGIGIYALEQQATDDPSLKKAKDKLWFYSPEIDSVIGDKSSIYEDIKSNPGNYQIQLVAPCGFFSDFFSSYVVDTTHRANQDMVSLPIHGAGVLAKTMFPPDAGSAIGRNDFITFGMWRNTAQQGAGIDATLTFVLSSAKDVDHNKNTRAPYLELTLASNIYYYDEVEPETCMSAKSQNFHEPWYIINIIQNKNVPDNNINYYNDIGHSIRLESTIGESNGQATQTFQLVDERLVDIWSMGDTNTSYRYIYVNGLPWLGTNNTTGTAGYITTLTNTGSFTPSGGDRVCYGLYLVRSDLGNLITFPYILDTAVPIVPITGTLITVKYNPNAAIDVFLGDTYIHDASFLAIDTLKTSKTALNYTIDDFKMNAPMPAWEFTFKTSYHQAVGEDPPGVEATIWDHLGDHFVEYVRQWLIHFTCESTINLPLVYKNFFPNRLYAMRPRDYFAKLDDETLDEFFTRSFIYNEYNDDYPEEYLQWQYGGLSTPASSNFDYQKLLHTKSYTEPKSGANELLALPKRVHWSTQGMPGYNSTKTFLPTNIYDLKNDKASQISILYDVFSDRGSNLYVVTDRGAGMLLTDKNMITTAEGNNLTILAADASLIKGEVWLNASLGCPKEFWRGKSEGSIKLPNNIVAPILVFPSFNDIVMLSNNNFVEIADNNRKNILASLESIDADGDLEDVTGEELTDEDGEQLTVPGFDFDTKLFSVIDESENKLRMTIGNYTYVFNFDLNNWDGHIYGLKYDKSLYVPYLNGIGDRNVLAHLINDNINFGITISHKLPTRVTTIGDTPYVIFSVTPNIGSSWEFIDMFISSSFLPSSVVVATDRDFTDPSTVLAAKIQTYNSGWYYIQGLPRTVAGKRLIGKTLFVKVNFPDHLYSYDLKLVKVGFKEPVEG